MVRIEGGTQALRRIINARLETEPGTITAGGEGPVSTATHVLVAPPKSLGQIDKQQLTARVEVCFECVLTASMTSD